MSLLKAKLDLDVELDNEFHAAMKEAELENPDPVAPIHFSCIVPDMTDVFTKHAVWRWYVLRLNGDDVYADTCALRHRGNLPDWWQHGYADDEAGFVEQLLEADGYARGHLVAGALAHGITIRQPFLVRYGKPRYFKSSYEYNEWDMEPEFELMRVTALSERATLHRMGTLLCELSDSIQYSKAVHEYAARAARITKRAFFLATFTQFVNHYDRYPEHDSHRITLRSDGKKWLRPHPFYVIDLKTFSNEKSCSEEAKQECFNQLRDWATGPEGVGLTVEEFNKLSVQRNF